MLLQEFKSSNRNQDADFRFSKYFWFLVQFPGANDCLAPPVDAHESSPPYLFHKQEALEKISSDLATLGLIIF